MEPSTKKMSAAEERAQVNRDNAFMDLAKIANKISGPMLATLEMTLLAHDLAGPKPVKVVLHYAPVQVSEMLASFSHIIKQQQIVLNVLLNMLLEKNVLGVEEYMDRCAKDAEATTKLMTRGLLSQGQGGGLSGILRPS